MLTWRDKLIGLFIGMISGFFGGLLGLGGAFVIVPAAMSYLGMSRHRAHATSLAAMVFMAAASAAFYLHQGNSDLKLAGLLLAGSPVGVILGAKIMHRTPARTLGIFFGLFLVTMALKMGLGIKVSPNSAPLTPPVSYLLIILLGVVTGCLSGLLGVGGAVITIPGLVALAGVSQQTAQGVSLLALIPTALIGSYTHWKHGFINLNVVKWLTTTSFLFGIAGAYVANSISAQTLKTVFSLVLLLIGVRSVLTGFPKNNSRGEHNGSG